MKIALIDIKGDDARTINKNSSVNIRNMMELADKIGAKFYYNTAMLDNAKYDAVIFGFGSISTEINKTVEFVTKSGANAFFWLVGEYEQSMNPALYYCCKNKGIKFTTIQNFDTSKKGFGKYCKEQKHVNINLLISKNPNQLSLKKYDCIYYSRWRPDRSKYLKQYLHAPIYFSSDNKNFKQHKHIGCNPIYIKKLTWSRNAEELNLFRYTLYIEDVFTHTCFNNLANRWYEAGFCNNVVFFDVNCWNTIRKSEIAHFEDQIKDYIVTSHSDLMAKIECCNKDFEKHLAIQKTWRMGEQLLKSQMINEIKRITNGI